jgi:hypothetical protein
MDSEFAPNYNCGGDTQLNAAGEPSGKNYKLTCSIPKSESPKEVTAQIAAGTVCKNEATSCVSNDASVEAARTISCGTGANTNNP